MREESRDPRKKIWDKKSPTKRLARANNGDFKWKKRYGEGDL
jgi:hypothetical protein